MAKRKSPAAAGFPSREDVLEFIADSPTPVGKREIARAFHIRGDQRRQLNDLLRDLRAEGHVGRPERRKLAQPGHLPAVAVVDVVAIDRDGDLVAKPAAWPDDEEPPRILVLPEGRQSRQALGVGDRLLARLSRIGEGRYEARVIRRLTRPPKTVMGVLERADGGLRLRATDKREKNDYKLATGDSLDAQVGELVLAEVKAGHPRLGLKDVRVRERFGRVDNPKAFSLIAIHGYGIPLDFPEQALAEAEAARAAELGRRKDLRALPLVTIDDADARDFDDAVFAEPDDDPANEGGWHLVVAIADVAHYVRPGSALDREAEKRGNSVYFPDRVVPMLPEALSNGWCSLVPGEDRPCLCVHLWIDGEGALLRHRFERAMMRSAARLTYAQVQARHDGRVEEEGAQDIPEALAEGLLPALYGAYQALLTARKKRGALDLDLAERRIRLDETGEIAGVETRQRLDSHRLIEEFMIAANVAAASELETRRQPCMYRVHEPPDPAKIEALRSVLETIGLRFSKGQVVRPQHFMRLLEQAAGSDHAVVVNQMVLRTQSQARYAPDNLGHFGLGLRRYAHFTSPIRRYADLLVHRALLRVLAEKQDALPKGEEARFEEVGQAISECERRAAAAERDTLDRLAAAYLANRVGARFEATVSGVNRFGLFLRLSESGADGLLPISRLPDDYYLYDEHRQWLEGRRWGRRYRLGQVLRVRLSEAEPLSGSLLFELDEKARRESEDDDGAEAGGWDPLRGGGSRSRRKARRR